MVTWNLPADDPDESAEWAHSLATDFLQRRGCDETCQALGALLSADLVRQAVAHRVGPVELHIDHVDYEVELRVRAARVGAVTNEDELVLMRRLATSWGQDTTGDQPVTWCRFGCLEGPSSPCHAAPTDP
jgi:hypothetical protein